MEETTPSLSQTKLVSASSLAKRWLSIILPAILVVLVDQGSKAWVLSDLGWGESWSPIPSLASIFSLTLITNSGAAFGILPEGGLFFTIFTLIVIGVVVLIEGRIPFHPLWLRPSIGLLLGGAVGNLIDRLLFGGVIDFIDFHFWPVFNIADSAIVLGVLLLALYYWRSPRERVKNEGGEAH